jgi:competence protein ComEA
LRFIIMNLNIEPLKDWFGFTRRERRSSFLMLLIVFLIIGLRYTIPESRIAIDYVADTISAEEKPAEQAGFEYGSLKRVSSLSNNQVKHYSDMRARSGANSTGNFSTHSSSLQKVRIDINTADSAAFEKLYGIGPVLSARIIKYRRLLGGFARVEQLKEVYGLSAETFESVRGRIFADSTVITMIIISVSVFKRGAKLEIEKVFSKHLRK